MVIQQWESKRISMQNPYDQGLINTPQFEMWISQWPSQEPKLEVPTIYKTYVREYTHKIWPYMMVQYLHFRILKFPLNL